jgi:hypothetical protein
VGERHLPGLTGHVSWVEEARQEVQRQEASRSCVPSMEDPFVSTGFSTVTEEATSQEDWRVGFASVTEGATSEADWTTGFASVTEDATSQEDWRADLLQLDSVTEGETSQEDWSALVEETESLPVGDRGTSR